MTNSVQLDAKTGPDWPLGFVAVTTPGTPVNIMINVDPGLVNDPSYPVPSSSGTFPPPVQPYTIQAMQIIFQGFKPGAAGNGMIPNTGVAYVVRKGVPPGTGNKADQGSTVLVIPAGQIVALNSYHADIFSPYRYSIDADTAGEGALVTLIFQG